MKFNFDFTLTSLDGQALTDEDRTPLHAARTLANVIARQPDSRDALKRFDWAQQLYKSGCIDLDKAGQQEFRELITNIPGLLVLMRGQYLEVIEKKLNEFSNNKSIEDGKS
jgi:hypothetical protein